MIERVIVKAAKPFPPFIIRPDPFLESFLDALLFFACGFGGLRVDDRLLVHVIINGGRFEVQRFLDEFEGGITVRSPIGCVRGRPFRLPIGGDVPRAEGVDVADLNTRRNAEQSVDEILHVRRRQPGCSKAHVNLGGGQILRLHRFQRLDIFMETDIGNTGRVRRNQLFADIAGEILVFGFPLFALRVEKNHSPQIRQKLPDRFAEQTGHVFQIHPALFIQRNQQRFLG